MKKRRKKPRGNTDRTDEQAERAPKSTRVPETSLRIIGGRFRNSRIRYSGDRCVRPMKDRVREALFNLVGPSIKGTHVIDLFAGTGALAFESLSRGAVSATAIERHFPTAKIVRENAKQLKLTDVVEVVTHDTFIWLRMAGDGRMRLPQHDRPWLVLCSPPYKLFVERGEDMDFLIATLMDVSPPGSIFVVEAIEEWDWGRMPQADQWDVRAYHPAILGMYRKPPTATTTS